MSQLPYRRIATAVRDLQLSPYAGWLLTTITLHINPFTNCLEMSLAQLAEAAGMSERSVTRWIKVLEKMHLVTVTRRKKANSQESLPNRYALTGICLETVVTERQNPVVPDCPTPSDTESQKRIKTLDINHDENDSSNSIKVSNSDFQQQIPDITNVNYLPLPMSKSMAILIGLGVAPLIAQRYASNETRVLGWIAYVKRRELAGDPVQNSAAYVVKMLQKQEDAPSQYPSEICPEKTHPDDFNGVTHIKGENSYYFQTTSEIVSESGVCDRCRGSVSRFVNHPRCTCDQPNALLSNKENCKSDPSKPEQIWNNAYNQLRLQLDSYSFETWIAACEYTAFDDGLFTIAVKNSYAEVQLNGRYRRLIERIVSTVAGETLHVHFVCSVALNQSA